MHKMSIYFEIIEIEQKECSKNPKNKTITEINSCEKKISNLNYEGENHKES
jgi:hypothetical protein